MDIGLAPIGVNTGLIFLIILATQGIKKLDKKGKFKKFYILVPLLLGIGAAFLTASEPLIVKEIIMNSIIYAGVSGYFYKSGKLAFGKKEKNDNTN